LIRLAANLSYLFTELPFLDRFAAAAAAGFRAVEWNFAYDVPTTELAAQLRGNGLSVALINTPAGDTTSGELGLGVLPGRQADLDAAFDLAMERALALKVPIIHFLAGRPAPDSNSADVDLLFLENMTRAADVAAQQGIAISLEPLNPRDRPGYHLLSVAHAMRLIKRAGRDNIKLQMDLYHCQITGGDIIHTLQQTIDHLGHVQIAGVPDRAEPTTGELAFGVVLARLDALGYSGYVGCEYVPAAGTLAGLGWAAPYLQMSASVPSL
jgi:2-dehydrotetronate isomerase